MRKYKCPRCGKETLSLMQKANLLAGEEYGCTGCAVVLKMDGLFQLVMCILATLSLSISFVLVLLMFGFMVAVPVSIAISILIYLVGSAVVPVEEIKN